MNFSIVDAVQSHLSSAVFNGHAGDSHPIFISQRHQEGTHTIVLAVEHQFGKSGRHLAVYGCVADVFFLCAIMGCIDHKGPRLVVIRCRCFDTTHVGSVAGFCHGKTSW